MANNHEGPPTIIATEQTPEEEANIALCKHYMSIAYSPSRASGSAVAGLCTADATFISPSTFPGCETPLDYADSHAHVMRSVPDLHILRFDTVFAKNGHILLRYSAEGSFSGEDYDAGDGRVLKANGKKASWGASAIFEVEGGKIKAFRKDWDQKVMQIQLGWAPVNESKNPRWNAEALANPEEARRKKKKK